MNVEDLDAGKADYLAGTRDEARYKASADYRTGWQGARRSQPWGGDPDPKGPIPAPWSPEPASPAPGTRPEPSQARHVRKTEESTPKASQLDLFR